MDDYEKMATFTGVVVFFGAYAYAIWAYGFLLGGTVGAVAALVLAYVAALLAPFTLLLILGTVAFIAWAIVSG